MPRLALPSLEHLRVSRHLIPAFRGTPNCSLQHRPLLIYHSVFPESTSATQIEQHVNSLAVVKPQWQNTMFSYSHFHSTTHEILCISKGRARLCFGVDENPDRVETVVAKGDALIIPAGVAHRMVEDIEGGFTMVGCYPPGKDWDMCYGKSGEEGKIKSISELDWFTKDPFYGDRGPALETG